MPSESEIQLILDRYKRRNAIEISNRYNMLNPSVWKGVQEKQRALISILAKHTDSPLSNLKALEIGCGNGGNLLELIRLGFSPENLIGNELLPERFEAARNNLPLGCQLEEGDACLLNHPDESIDIVYQSTVFSSILDDKFQERLSDKMWQWLKPGGGILWYDFTYDNPRNKDVCGVPLKRIKELFPNADVYAKRITLAPPISRMVTKISPNLYTLFNFAPFLRTHLMCWLKKSN